MKRILLILLIVAVLAGLAIGATVFFFTNQMADSATAFFQSVRDGNAQEAYTHLSQDFRKDLPQDELLDTLAQRHLDTYQILDWSSRSMHGEYGLLSGTITAQSGAVAPLTVELVKEGPDWKIYSIMTPSSGLRDNPAPMGMPNEQELVKLVATSMNQFAAAVQKKNMQDFYDHISNLWQQQTSVEKLNQNFQSFFTLKDDMTVISNMSPIFDEKPQIGDNGTLRISGYYPTHPSRLRFNLTYLYEGLGWKLAGINVQVK